MAKKIKPPVKTESGKKKGGWFLSKIPKNTLVQPGGILLLFFAIVMEIIDLIPLPVFDQIWEIPLEIIFIILLTFWARVPLKSSFIPFLIERIPGISDFLPTWVIRMFI